MDVAENFICKTQPQPGAGVPLRECTTIIPSDNWGRSKPDKTWGALRQIPDQQLEVLLEERSLAPFVHRGLAHAIPARAKATRSLQTRPSPSFLRGAHAIENSSTHRLATNSRRRLGSRKRQCGTSGTCALGGRSPGRSGAPRTTNDSTQSTEPRECAQRAARRGTRLPGRA